LKVPGTDPLQRSCDILRTPPGHVRPPEETGSGDPEWP